MTRATLRRELERLKRDSGWYEAVEAEIAEAIAFGEASPEPELEDAYEDLYA